MQAAATALARPPKAKKVYIPPLPPPMTTNPSSAAFEQRFFHHFRDCTVKDLAFPSYRINFWYESVLPPAQGNESVRHALVALGAAHWLFLTRHSPSSPPMDEKHVRNLIWDQYNKSIHHLTTAMRGTESTDTEVTLICCLVFYCLENILGHYTESLRHLRSGARLLVSSCQTPSSSNSSPKSSRSSQATDALSELAEIFSQLGIDASLFLDGPLVPDLASYSRSVIEDRNVSGPFAGLVDARNQLGRIELDFNQTLEHYHSDWHTPELQVIYNRIRQWARHFDDLELALSGSSLSQSHQQDFLALKLSRAVWLAIVGSTTSDVSERTLSGILDLAEPLIRSLSLKSHPVFTLQADLVPALMFVCDTADNIDVQRRAITLLRSIHRREGLWDSQEMAEYLEHSLVARRSLQQDWDNTIGGVPGGARALCSMNVSSFSADNGILLMANQAKTWQSQ